MITVNDFKDPNIDPPMGWGGDEDWVITAPIDNIPERDAAEAIANSLTISEWRGEEFPAHGLFVIVTCHA